MKCKTKRKITYSFLSIILIIVVIFFTISSSLFLTKVLAPGIGYLIETDFVIEKASFNPFTSYLELEGLRIGDKDNPFLTGKSGSAYFSLFSLFEKTLKFDNIQIDKIDINFIKDKNNKWSIPWIYVDDTKLFPIKLDFPKSHISNLTLNYINLYGKNKTPLTIKATNLDLVTNNFKNEHLSKVKFFGDILINYPDKININKGKTSGEITVTLDKWCIPSQLKLSAISDSVTGIIRNEEIENWCSNFEVDIIRDNKNRNLYCINKIQITDVISDITESKNNSSTSSKSNKPKSLDKLNSKSNKQQLENMNKNSVSTLNLTGSFNVIDESIKLNILADPFHHSLINLFTNLFGGFKVGESKLFYNGKIDISRDEFKSDGKFSLTNFNYINNGYNLLDKSDMNFNLDYNIIYNRIDKILEFNDIKSEFSEGKNSLVTASLNKPSSIYFGTKNIKNAPPEITFSTNNLKLKLLNIFLQSDMRFSSGTLNSNLILSINPSNNDLTLNGKSKINNLTAYIGTVNLNNLNFEQNVDVSVSKLQKITVNESDFLLSQNTNEIAQIKLSGYYDLFTLKGNIKTTIPYIKERIIKLFPWIFKYKSNLSIFMNKVSPFSVGIKNSISFNLMGNNKFIIKDFELKYKNPEESSGLIFILQKPFSFKFKQNNIIIDEDIRFNSKGNKFKLNNLNEFIPKHIHLTLDKGYIKYDLIFTIPKTLDSVKIDGKAKFLYADLRLFRRPISNLSIVNKINAVINSADYINFNNSTTEFFVNGVLGLTTKVDGKLAISKTNNSNFIITVKELNKYFFDIFRNGISNNIVSLNASGKLEYNHSSLNQTSSIKGHLKLPKAILNTQKKEASILTSIPNQTIHIERTNTNNDNTPINVSGNFEVDILENKNNFNINKINLSLLKNSEKLLKLKTNGHFPIPVNSGLSNLSITSDRMAIGQMIEIITTLFQKTLKPVVNNTSPPKTIKPMNFSGLNLKGNIDFNNITCGKLIKSNFCSIFSIKNNQIEISQNNFKINNTNILFYGSIDTGFTNGYPFNFNTQFKNFDLMPLIRTFIKGDFKKIKGIVKSFNFYIHGKGFTKTKIKNNLKGHLSILLSNLSLPYKINSLKFLKAMLIPLEVLEKVRDMVPGGLLYNNLAKGAEDTKNIFTDLDNINLKTGEIDLNAKDGVVNLAKVHFLGNESDTIKYSDFSGTVTYSGDINIKANSNISGVRLPISITGTLKQPNPVLTSFLPKFLFANTLNILNPMNEIDFLWDTGKGIVNTLIGGGQTIAQPFVESTAKPINDGSK